MISGNEKVARGESKKDIQNDGRCGSEIILINQMQFSKNGEAALRNSSEDVGVGRHMLNRLKKQDEEEEEKVALDQNS